MHRLFLLLVLFLLLGWFFFFCFVFAFVVEIEMVCVLYGLSNQTCCTDEMPLVNGMADTECIFSFTEVGH